MFRYLPVGPVLLACALGTIAALTMFALAARRGGLRRAVVVASRVALAGVVLAVLAVTLTTSGGGPGVNLVPGEGIAQQLRNPNTGLGLVNIVGNVVMFVPVGALAVVAFASGWGRATVSGVALSLLVELSQLVLGRSADVDDVLLNSCGAALGAAVAGLASYLRSRRMVAD